MKKKIIDWILVGAGIGLLFIGIFCLRMMDGQAFPYLCIGLGCGLFAHGFGGRIESRAARSDPAAAHRREIEKNDERNTELENHSKAKAFDLVQYVFAAMLLAFCLMNVQWNIILLLTVAYLLINGYRIYWRIRMEQNM